MDDLTRYVDNLQEWWGGWEEERAEIEKKVNELPHEQRLTFWSHLQELDRKKTALQMQMGKANVSIGDHADEFVPMLDDLKKQLIGSTEKIKGELNKA